MNELFTIDECKSPRLRWMEKHGIRVYRNDTMTPPFIALCTFPDEAVKGETEDEAIVGLAKKLNIKLWNEL